MPEYGTPGFNEIWRQKGYFAAIDSSPMHGQAPKAEMRKGTFTIGRMKAAEMRKELKRLAVVIDRLDHHMMVGISADHVDESRLGADVVELGGWIASLIESYVNFEYTLNESRFQKSRGMIQDELLDKLHRSRYSYATLPTTNR